MNGSFGEVPSFLSKAQEPMATINNPQTGSPLKNIQEEKFPNTEEEEENPKSDNPEIKIQPEQQEFIKSSESLENQNHISRRSRKVLGVKWATLFIALGMLFAISIQRYNHGIVRTLERRFSLSSVGSAFLNTLVDILQCITSGILGYAGTKTNKMKLLAFTSILTGFGMFISASPFVIFGAKNELLVPKTQTNVSQLLPMSANPTISHLLEMHSNNEKDQGLTEHLVEDLCILDRDKAFDECSAEIGDDDKKRNMNHITFVSYYILIAGTIVASMSSTPYFILGMAYLEENSNSSDSSIYIGVVIAMLVTSKLLGTLLASFVLSIPESLVGDGLSTKDPAFIGAWWLGYVILGVLLILVSIPMCLLPKHTPYYMQVVKPNKRKDMGKVGMNMRKHIKEFGCAVYRVVTNVNLMYLMVSHLLGLYMAVGVINQLPRYLEIHFKQQAYIANSITAGVAAVSGMLGVLTGSAILKKFGSTQKLMYQLYLVTHVASVLTVFMAMLLSCPQRRLFGDNNHLLATADSVNQTLACNTGCGCSLTVFLPVCDEQGLLYSSPCIAGCSSFHNQTYMDCSCVDGLNKIVSEKLCEEPTCASLIPFCILLLVSAFIVSIGTVPGMQLIFTLLEPQDKAIGLSVRTTFINFGVFASGQMLFGWMVDQTCSIWRQHCSVLGACMVYNTRHLRLYTYGGTSAFLTASCILAVILYVRLARNKFTPVDMVEDKKNIKI